jgi:hypothetical protein
MKKLGMVICMAVGALLVSTPVFAQNDNHQGQGHAVITVLAKHGGETPAGISQQDLKLAVNGKQSNITNWVSLRGPEDPLELVLLIDSAARTSLGRQLDEMAQFIKSLPPNTKSTIGYMQNGQAVLSGPLSADHAQVLRGLHLPVGSAGSSASPYFCLSDLAKHWPSTDRLARREVVMVTDGVDYYNLRYDPDDPYLQAAIADSVRSGLVVYSIYWRNQGFVDRSSYETSAGQNLLAELTQATGGNSYWMGNGNPVSFAPFFKDLSRRLGNQYKLSFDARLNGKPEIESLKLKFKAPETEIDAPQQVFVGRAGTAVN